MGRTPDPLVAVCRALAWALLLALLAAQVWGLYLLVPGPGEPLLDGQDKVAHAVLFGVPTGLALLLRARLVVVAIVVHALVSEPLQAWLTATRAADVWDLVADLVGIAVAVGLVLVLRARRRPVPAPVAPSVPASAGGAQ